MPATRPRSRILLAAEDAIICRLIGRGLAGEHDVVDVGAGSEALSLLARGERFDVVVFDTHLEDGLDSATFYDRLCAEHPAYAKRTVMMSRTVRDSLDPAFVQRFGGVVLVKPFDLEELSTAIESVSKV